MVSKSEYDLASALNIVVDLDILVNNGWIVEEVDDFVSMKLTEKSLKMLSIVVDLGGLATTLGKIWGEHKLGTRNVDSAIENRLRLFVREYPKYDAETIAIAAASYVDSCRPADYKYLKTTANTILEKDTFGDVISVLASFCEDVVNNDGIEDLSMRA